MLLGPQMPGEGSATVPLVPPMLEDAGVYICMAVNRIGVEVKNITVNVMGMLVVSVVYWWCQWCHE